MNSKAQGLIEAELACKFYGLSLTSRKRISPFNNRVRLAVRSRLASQKRFLNNYTRQQARAENLKHFKEIQQERRDAGELPAR
jgi:hypothetical protein